MNESRKNTELGYDDDIDLIAKHRDVIGKCLPERMDIIITPQFKTTEELACSHNIYVTGLYDDEENPYIDHITSVKRNGGMTFRSLDTEDRYSSIYLFRVDDDIDHLLMILKHELKHVMFELMNTMYRSDMPEEDIIIITELLEDEVETLVCEVSWMLCKDAAEPGDEDYEYNEEKDTETTYWMFSDTAVKICRHDKL